MVARPSAVRGVLRPARRRLGHLGGRAIRRRRGCSSARTGSCARTSCPAGGSRTTLDFQDQLDSWCDRANRRVHRTIRAVPAERLVEERARMRPLPGRLPDTDRRTGSPRPAAAVSTDRSQRLLDRPSARGPSRRCSRLPDRGDRRRVGHRRARTPTPALFAGGLTLTDPAHQTELEQQRALRRQRHEIDVEIRPLTRYDALIPASANGVRAGAPVPRR